jgi:HlyD family secretion protein
MKMEEKMHSHPVGKTMLIVLCVAMSYSLAGCSHPKANTYQGYIEGKFVYVASPQSGRLDDLAVNRGETVAAGHPLFTLDNEPEAAEERMAEQVLRAAQSRFVDLQTGKRPAEVDVTRAQLVQAVVEKKQAEQILASDEAQYRAGGIPQTEIINAQAVVETSTAKVQELQASLAVDTLPAREQQVREQRNQVAADRASLSEAAWKLGQKRVASPREGLVVDTLYRQGEWVAAGNPIVQILPPENLEIRFFVPESGVGRLRVGESIRLDCDGCAGNIPATINFVSPQSEYTPPVIFSNENRSKLVFLVIAKPPEQIANTLHPGQPVEVTLP